MKRKEIKKNIKEKVKTLEEKVLNDKIQQLERYKNDSNKYYQVMRNIRK